MFCNNQVGVYFTMVHVSTAVSQCTAEGMVVKTLQSLLCNSSVQPTCSNSDVAGLHIEHIEFRIADKYSTGAQHQIN